MPVGGLRHPLRLGEVGATFVQLPDLFFETFLVLRGFRPIALQAAVHPAQRMEKIADVYGPFEFVLTHRATLGDPVGDGYRKVERP